MIVDVSREDILTTGGACNYLRQTIAENQPNT